jgi:hypothetical protein
MIAVCRLLGNYLSPYTSLADSGEYSREIFALDLYHHSGSVAYSSCTLRAN